MYGTSRKRVIGQLPYSFLDLINFPPQTWLPYRLQWPYLLPKDGADNPENVKITESINLRQHRAFALHFLTSNSKIATLKDI